MKLIKEVIYLITYLMYIIESNFFFYNELFICTVKKATIPSSNLVGSTPWHHPGSSPSSLSSGGSVSPPAVDPSPSKTGIFNIRSTMQVVND